MKRLLILTFSLIGSTYAITATPSPAATPLTTNNSKIVSLINCTSGSPCAVVASTSSLVMDTIDKSTSTDDLIARITSDVAPKFDFKLMTMYALGNNWKSANTKQKDQLTSLFRDLLVFTYSSALSKFKNTKITIIDQNISQISSSKSKASVISQVILPNSTNNQPVKVEYDLVKTDNQDWKAYDIKIENASLVTTYRNQFNDIIQSSSIDGLIKQLQTKINNLKTKSSS